MSDSLVLSFEVEWYDDITEILNILYLKYYKSNQTIELIRNNKIFLKRIHVIDIKENDLYIGNSLTIYNRLYTIKLYANTATSNYLSPLRHNLLVHLSTISDLPIVLDRANSLNDVRIKRMKTIQSTRLLNGWIAKSGDILIEFICMSDRNSTNNIIKLISSISDVKIDLLDDITINNVFKNTTTPPVPDDCTLGLVKPHIVKSNQLGKLLSHILDNKDFEIYSCLSIQLSMNMSNELFSIYQSIYTNYHSMIKNICNNISIALIIIPSTKNQRRILESSSADVSIVGKFREFCGPYQPELAKTLRPNSIRSLFGSSIYSNAIHCTDLDEDGIVECKYIYNTIDKLDN